MCLDIVQIGDGPQTIVSLVASIQTHIGSGFCMLEFIGGLVIATVSIRVSRNYCWRHFFLNTNSKIANFVFSKSNLFSCTFEFFDRKSDLRVYYPVSMQ